MNDKSRHIIRIRWLVLSIIIGLCLFVVVSLVGKRSPRPLSDVIAARNPQWSPDGTYLVLECAFDIADYSYPNHEVCLAKHDLSGLIRLTPRITDSSVAPGIWSPSGAELAFATPQGLAIATVPAGTIQLLGNSGCHDPTWSPDGKRIACAREAKGIIVVDVTGANAQLFTTSPYDSFPLWMPNGQALLFIRGDAQFKQYAIYILNLASREEQRLATGLGPLQPTMAVSSDGAQLAYPSNSGTSLEVMQLATRTSKNILAAYGPCFKDIIYPQWSHDGRYLAFLAIVKPPPDGQIALNAQLLIVDLATAQVFQLTQFEGAIVQAIGPPSWSPDDTQIATSFGANSQQLASKVLTISVAPLLQSPLACT